jgi:protein-disulfide isomerase
MIQSRTFTALCAAAFLLAGCAKAQQQAPKDVDPAFGEKVRAYLMNHPEVLRDALTQLDRNDKLAEAKAATQVIAPNRAKIENDPRDFVVHPNAKITVTEFFDYQCGYCKLAAPDVMAIIQANPDVRFVFKEFPIFGGVSDTAAALALTPAVKAKGLDIYKRWMDLKPVTEAGLDAEMRNAGIDPALARQQAKDPGIAKQIADVRALATVLKIGGTPHFVIGGIAVSGADMNAVKAAIVQAKAEGIK